MDISLYDYWAALAMSELISQVCQKPSYSREDWEDGVPERDAEKIATHAYLFADAMDNARLSKAKAEYDKND